MTARSSAYAYFLETVVGKSEVYMLERRGAKTDPCGMPFLRHHNLLRLLPPVVRVKLRLPTSSMIMRTMCLSGSNRRSLKMRPRYRNVVGCCEMDKHSSGLLSRKAILIICLASVRRPDLWSTSPVESPLVPSGAMGRSLVRQERRWVFRGLWKGHTVEIYGDSSLDPKMDFPV